MKQIKSKFKPSKKSLVKAFKYWRDFDEESAEQLLQKINKLLGKIKSL